MKTGKEDELIENCDLAWYKLYSFVKSEIVGDFVLEYESFVEQGKKQFIVKLVDTKNNF